MRRIASEFRRTFSSLRVRNFRLFIIAQVVSVIGTWMQSIAQMWLVLHLTGSGVALGITAALQFLPMLLFGTFGGLLADRMDKRRLLMLTQALAAMTALVLAALTLTALVQLWMVFGLAFALGMVNVFDNPARQSFVTELVGRDSVSNAVGLNSAVFTGARVVGPAIAGVLITFVGTGYCFLFNGLSYFPVVFALLLMRTSELNRVDPMPRAKGQIRDGLRHAWERPELRFPLLLMLVIGLLAFNFSVLMPLMARYVFNSGAGTFGLLMSFMGIGSFVGALFSANRKLPTHRLLTLAGALLGVFLVGAAIAPNLWLELAVLIPMGGAMTTFQATANSLLQLNSEPRFRGRVMALYVIVFIGSTPIGGPIVGLIAQLYGARVGLAVGGVAALSASLVISWFQTRWKVGVNLPGGRGGSEAPTKSVILCSSKARTPR